MPFWLRRTIHLHETVACDSDYYPPWLIVVYHINVRNFIWKCPNIHTLISFQASLWKVKKTGQESLSTLLFVYVNVCHIRDIGFSPSLNIQCKHVIHCLVWCLGVTPNLWNKCTNLIDVLFATNNHFHLTHFLYYVSFFRFFFTWVMCFANCSYCHCWKDIFFLFFMFLLLLLLFLLSNEYFV